MNASVACAPEPRNRIAALLSAGSSAPTLRHDLERELSAAHLRCRAAYSTRDWRAYREALAVAARLAADLCAWGAS